MKFCFAMLALPALLLASCGEKQEEEDDRKASGQVLEGTISDDMLPLETVTSQPPLMKSDVKPGAATDDEEADGPEDPASLDAEQPAVESAVE